MRRACTDSELSDSVESKDDSSPDELSYVSAGGSVNADLDLSLWHKRLVHATYPLVKQVDIVSETAMYSTVSRYDNLLLRRREVIDRVAPSSGDRFM